MGKKWRWGVIVDAGSSGSRVHVYRWKDPTQVRAGGDDDDHDRKDLHRLPKIKTKWTKKIRPGISTFGDKPAQVGADHLAALVRYALDVVPADQAADTPIFLMATAGMRLLPAAQQAALLRETCAYLRQHAPFALPDCAQHIQVIRGETEGLFGWLAANYLLGGFDRPQDHVHGGGPGGGGDHHTYGFLDMGGASAQIAFAPNATEAAAHADALQLVRLRTLDGEPAEHRVFTATWLGFGVNQARAAYVQALVGRIGGGGGDIPDPCMPKGLRTALDGTALAGTAPALVGTGDFARCLVATKPLLVASSAGAGAGADAAACGSEAHHPCLIHDAVPSIDFRVNHFVGVSEYYHSTHGFFDETDDGDVVYDFATYQRNVRAFCERDWARIAAEVQSGGKKHKQPTAGDADRALQDAQQACFKASWVISVLHEGIGIPRVGLEPLPGSEGAANETAAAGGGDGSADGVAAFRPVDKIDSVEVSWTLGRMLLYASGQVPPRGVSGSGGGHELPVGFGSNVQEGIPPDFTYAGSTWEPPKTGGDWDDDLLGDKAEGARPLVVFLLVVVVLGFLLRKKDRRLRLMNKAGALVRRARGGGGGGSGARRGRFGPVAVAGGHDAGVLASLAKRLFRRHARDYERVLEEGQLDDAFELGDADSQEGGSYRESDEGGSSSSSSSSSAVPQLAVDGGGSAMDRSGLVVRTESRERLGLGLGLGGAPASLQMLNAGRRSRAGSPTRLKSPLMTPLPED